MHRLPECLPGGSSNRSRNSIDAFESAANPEIKRCIFPLCSAKCKQTTLWEIPYGTISLDFTSSQAYVCDCDVKNVTPKQIRVGLLKTFLMLNVLHKKWVLIQDMMFFGIFGYFLYVFGSDTLMRRSHITVALEEHKRQG